MVKLQSFDELNCGTCGGNVFFAKGSAQGLELICASCGEQILLKPEMHLSYWDIIRYGGKVNEHRGT